MLYEILINRKPDLSDDEFICDATEQFIKQMADQLEMSNGHVHQHVKEAIEKLV